MKTLWCWRCRMELPMLDEDEFALIAILYREAFRPAGKSHISEGLPSEKITIDERFRPLRENYKELTGFDETNHLRHPPSSNRNLRRPLLKLRQTAQNPTSRLLRCLRSD